MLIGLLMLLAPASLYLATLPISGRFRPALRKVYRILGGIIVFVGSGISFYFAAFTGDQGGIAAYFFQMAVIAAYLLGSIVLIGLNWLLGNSEERK